MCFLVILLTNFKKIPITTLKTLWGIICNFGFKSRFFFFFFSFFMIHFHRHWLALFSTLFSFLHSFIIIFLKYILLCILYLHLITIKSILGEWEMGSRHTHTQAHVFDPSLFAKFFPFLSIDESLPFMLLINIIGGGSGEVGMRWYEFS